MTATSTSVSHIGVTYSAIAGWLIDELPEMAKDLSRREAAHAAIAIVPHFAPLFR
jgi:hypothetical protein